jgi:alpha-L-fucosidase
MKILAYHYGSDLMWCDLGAPTIIKTWVQEWWESARQEGREVALNNRCNGVPDYDTAVKSFEPSPQSNR